MKKYFQYSALFFFLLIFSCGNHESSKTIQEPAANEEKLFVDASLIASFSNYTNPRDRKLYFLVDVKLINNSPEDYEFYSLSCGSLVNIVSDTQQAEFLYHNCSNDFAITIKLTPHQVYSVPVIMVTDKYNNMTYPSVRFGFIANQPKKRFGRNVPMDKQEIMSELKDLRQSRENVMWSKPVILCSNSNSNPYEIRSALE